MMGKVGVANVPRRVQRVLVNLPCKPWLVAHACGFVPLAAEIIEPRNVHMQLASSELVFSWVCKWVFRPWAFHPRLLVVYLHLDHFHLALVISHLLECRCLPECPECLGCMEYLECYQCQAFHHCCQV